MGVPALTPKEFYKVDVKLCYPFMDAVMNTLRIQCGIETKIGKPVFREGRSLDQYDIVVGATLSSDKILGQVVLCFNNQVFFAIISKLLGRKVSKMSVEVEDGAHELMNIVFNQSKKMLANKGMAAIRSIPMIVIGNAVKLRYLTRGTTVVMPFQSEIGAFSVEITTQEVNISDQV